MNFTFRFVSGLLLAIGALALPAALQAALSASVHASSNQAGARPVALSATFRTELRCGRVFSGKVVLRLPPAERLPASVSPAAVTVSGVHPARVALAKHTLTASLPRRKGVSCMSIVVGPVTIAIAASADLGNPASPGTYVFAVGDGGDMAAASLKVR